MNNKLNYQECENCKDWTGCITDCMNICGKPLDALEEFNQYRSIGTVEECREAVEKQKAIARVVEAGEYYCPKCNHPTPYVGYCKCGQKLY